MYNSDFQILIQVVEKGISLLKKDVDKELLKAWSDYTISTLEIICKNKNTNILIDYLTFLISISNLTPYEQLNKTIQKLLDIAKVL